MFDGHVTEEQGKAMLATMKESGFEGLYQKHGLLYIRPQTPASHVPLLDKATGRITAAFRKAYRIRWVFGGVHACICGATGDGYDFFLPNGILTPSLCIHYIAYHRDTVPLDQLAKVLVLNYGEENPNQTELNSGNIRISA